MIKIMYVWLYPCIGEIMLTSTYYCHERGVRDRAAGLNKSIEFKSGAPL